MISDLLDIYQDGKKLQPKNNSYFLRKQPFYLQAIGNHTNQSIAVSKLETLNNFLLKNDITECWTRDGENVIGDPFTLFDFDDDAVEACRDEATRDQFAWTLANEKSVNLLREKVAEFPKIDTAIGVGRNYFCNSRGYDVCAVFYFKEIHITDFSHPQLHLTYFACTEQYEVSERWHLCLNKTIVEGFKLVFCE